MDALEAVKYFLAMASDCAIAMLENAAYIREEMPSIEFPDGLTGEVESACSELEASNLQVIREVRQFERDLQAGNAKPVQSMTRCKHILSSLAAPVRKPHQAVRA